MEPGRQASGRRTPFGRRVGRLVCVGVIAAVGCRSNQRYEGIEAELRTRERELAETRAELRNARQLNAAYDRGQHQAPGAVIAGGGAPSLPLRDITLGSGTGGIDDDGKPGDESFQVVIVPKDDDGTPVKVPAKVIVQAYAIGRDGIKSPIGRWEVSPDHLRKTWRGGLFTTGYFVPLQWGTPPTTERVRIAVRLVTLDGRPYEADKDVTIRPITTAVAPTDVILPPQGPTIGPAEELPLPAPAVRFAPPQSFTPPPR